MNKKFFYTVFLIGLSGLLLWGCGGGGGGGSQSMNPVSAADSGQISLRLNMFVKAISTGNIAEAQSYFSANLYSSTTSGNSEVLTIWDFGKNIGDTQDNASYAFIIPSDGIVTQSSVDASVKAYYIMTNATRIDLNFKMLKQENDWYIDDIQVVISTGQSYDLQSYFPIQSGDFWKYNSVDSQTGSKREITIVVSSATEVIDGRPVYTFETISNQLSNVKSSLLAPPGLSRISWRFSNKGGLYNYGTTPGSSYIFNNGQPLKLLEENFRVGDMATWTVNESFSGVAYSKTLTMQVMSPGVGETAFGQENLFPIVFIWKYIDGRSPDGITSGAEKWFLKKGFGLVGFSEYDPITNQERSKSDCYEAKVNNVSQVSSTIMVNNGSLPAGKPGEAYSYPLLVSGGTLPYYYSISQGKLPTGLALATSTGIISGTPTAGGVFSFTVKAVDAAGHSDTEDFSITIAPFTFAAEVPALGYVNENISVPLTVKGTTASVTWSISDGALPDGIKLESGRLGGTYTKSGTFRFTVKGTVADTSELATYSIVVLQNLSAASNASFAVALNGELTGLITTSGGEKPYAYEFATEGKPEWIKISADSSGNGLLSGKPDKIATHTLKIYITDKNSRKIEHSIIVSVTSTAVLTIAGTSQTIYMYPSATESVTLTVSGGTSPYTWKSTGSLPTGITFSQTGVLGGIPTTPGTYTFSVQATDNAGLTGNSNVTVVVLNELSISSSLASTMQSGVAVTGSFSASGGAAGYKFSLSSGALPTGLTLAQDGTVSGTPSAAGTYKFVVKLEDKDGRSKLSSEYSITVPADLVITSSLASTLQAGLNVTSSFSATGGTAPYVFSLNSGALPTGLTLAQNGSITGAPSTVGTYTFVVKVVDGNSITKVSSQYSVYVSPSSVLLLTVVSDYMYQNASTSATFSAGGGTPPYTWLLASGTLPGGMTFSQTGVLSGIPTNIGTYTFTVVASDSTGITGQSDVTIQVLPELTISNANVPQTWDAFVNVVGSFTASGGLPPYTFSQSGGTLPAGLTIASDGGLTGKTTATGSYTFSVTVTDSNNRTAIMQNIPLQIVPKIIIPTPLPQVLFLGTSFSQTMIASGGVEPYLWGFNGAIPSGLNLIAGTGVFSGTPTATGTYTFNIVVSDQNSLVGSRSYTIDVQNGLIIRTPPLFIAKAASQTDVPLDVFNSTDTLQWSLVNGALPTGMSIDPVASKLTGIPSNVGSYTFQLRAVEPSTGRLGTRWFVWYVLPDPPQMLRAKPRFINSTTIEVAFTDLNGDPVNVEGPSVNNASATLMEVQRLKSDITSVNIVNISPSDITYSPLTPNIATLTFPAGSFDPNCSTLELHMKGIVSRDLQRVSSPVPEPLGNHLNFVKFKSWQNILGVANASPIKMLADDTANRLYLIMSNEVKSFPIDETLIGGTLNLTVATSSPTSWFSSLSGASFRDMWAASNVLKVIYNQSGVLKLSEQFLDGSYLPDGPPYDAGEPTATDLSNIPSGRFFEYFQVGPDSASTAYVISDLSNVNTIPGDFDQITASSALAMPIVAMDATFETNEMAVVGLDGGLYRLNIDGNGVITKDNGGSSYFQAAAPANINSKVSLLWLQNFLVDVPDSSSQFLVAESENNCLNVFNTYYTNTPIHSISSGNPGQLDYVGRLKNPTAVALYTKNGYPQSLSHYWIIVADADGLQYFRLLQ
ncbi:MAG: putative Ig domain-containing protein [Candidatus Riflebacteria bacterium]|nr:putative Ig domain-containing protein [Candidatus Riflebacteria bacterium]